MYSFGLYILQLMTVSILLALALSVYMDGLRYTVLHVLGLAGIAAYAYGVIKIQSGSLSYLAMPAGLFLSTISGVVCAEAIRTVRGDGLTLATFGIGIGTFELFRFFKFTGGVYGMSDLSVNGLTRGISGALISTVVIALASALVLGWRRSLGGTISYALGLDEWAALSIGARVVAHQRIAGALSGLLAGVAGIYFAITTGFIEPRDFRPTLLLFPLAATILAAGKTPAAVVLTAASIVIVTQSVRFLGASPTLAGPLAEITIALVLATAVVFFRLRQKNTNALGS